MKKLLSITLFITLALSTVFNSASAENINQTNNINESKKDVIMKEYQKAIFNEKLNINEGISVQNAANNTSIAQIQENTVVALNEAGYNAYSITPENYDNMSTILNTDLSDLGIDSNYSYIIIVEGNNDADDSEISTQSAVSDFFYHNYNGTQYKLRWLTLYASDDPAMGKADSKNVLSSKVRSVIQNCLDSGIQSYVSSLSPKLKYFGTVASICGLSVANFNTSQTSTMNYNAGTNWTRRYTQVWSDYDNAWANGCCVEEANLYSYMSGLFYSASSNRYEQVPQDAVSDYRKSSKFDDFDWRKNYAVVGYLNGWIQWDIVGDVEYQYNGSTIITHRHNF